MFDDEVLTLARQVINKAAAQNIMISTVESCTGGLIAGALTSVSGSSAVLDRGFVTYSNDAKMDMVQVPDSLLQQVGAVATETAAAMAAGGLANSRARLALSVTGIAGPTGGTDDKPVGLVCFGVAQDGKDSTAIEKHFGDPGRDEIRRLTIITALQLALDALKDQSS